ncbi:MAG: 1-phosphofructokinase [Erysipelotrichaceae bacterium]
MIYTLCINPSLDYVTFVKDFNEGEVNRSYLDATYPGGKGINVSTILSRLGVDNIALGFLAGFSGKEVETLVNKRGIKNDFIYLEDGATRINVKLKAHVESEINAVGPTIKDEEFNDLLKKLSTINSGDILVLAGSVPACLSDSTYANIMNSLKNNEIKFIIDATSKLMSSALIYHPYLIKPNLEELSEMVDKILHSTEDVIDAAKEMQSKGAQNVLVSLGSSGAILVTSDNQVFESVAPCGQLVNSTGAGDSMLAGFISAILDGANYQDALTFSVSCGSATAFTSDLATKKQMKELYENLKNNCDAM